MRRNHKKVQEEILDEARLSQTKQSDDEGLPAPQALDEVQLSSSPINMSGTQLSPQTDDGQPEEMSRRANLRQEVDEMLMSLAPTLLAPRPWSVNRTLDR